MGCPPEAVPPDWGGSGAQSPSLWQRDQLQGTEKGREKGRVPSQSQSFPCSAAPELGCTSHSTSRKQHRAAASTSEDKSQTAAQQMSNSTDFVVSQRKKPRNDFPVLGTGTFTSSPKVNEGLMLKNSHRGQKKGEQNKNPFRILVQPPAPSERRPVFLSSTGTESM